MKTADIAATLKGIQGEIENILEPNSQRVISIMLNLIERSGADNEILRQENQTLKDENSRLKGEQGKPKIKPNKDGNISSEQERKDAEALGDETFNREGYKLDKDSLEKLKEDQLPAPVLEKLEKLKRKKFSSKTEFLDAVELEIGSELASQYRVLLVKYARYKKRNRKAKLPEIKIDRVEMCPVDREQVPADAKFKEYEEKVVQDLIIKTDNVKFKREVYYSPSQKKTFLAKVPVGYEGDFGPNIKSQIVSMKYINNMSIPKILECLKNYGIKISSSYISDCLVKSKHMKDFHREKSEIYEASLATSSYQQIDDTSSRVNGQNYYTHIICNPTCTLFFTEKRKDRLTILDILRNFNSRKFIFNTEAFSLLEKLKVSKKLIGLLYEIKEDKVYSEEEIEAMLNRLFPDPNKGKLNRIRIMEAGAIAYYHHDTGTPIVQLLVSDDAPQFKLLTNEQGLCWVHDWRLYKRLSPMAQLFQQKLERFGEDYWNYYKKLFRYKQNPTPDQVRPLSDDFDNLFSTKTGYDDLDDRIAKSKAKKEQLLAVLKHPEIPLHNNLSENGARVQKRRADVSLQTKTEEGTSAKDTMMSIVETCKKVRVNAYEFIHDRVAGIFKMPSLAEKIRDKAAD